MSYQPREINGLAVIFWILVLILGLGTFFASCLTLGG